MQSPNGFGFGSRFIVILEAVERTGSIKHAATEVGWSYRRVWSRIKRTEQALGREDINFLERSFQSLTLNGNTALVANFVQQYSIAVSASPSAASWASMWATTNASNASRKPA